MELHIIAKKVLRYNHIQRFVILTIFLLFLLLLIKNPYSGQNIISDFEPLPDSIHYVSPARSFISGQGLQITYEGRPLSPSVPPFYSLFLTPFYFFSNDARSYYFANVLLAIFSVGMFYFIMVKLKLNFFLRIICFFCFCTSIYIYWYPSVPMAENLFLPLYLLSIYLLLSKTKIRNIIVAGFVCVSFYATKYIDIMVSGVFGLVYLYKIVALRQDKKFFYLDISIFIISVVVPLFLFDFIEYINKGYHIWPIGYFIQIFQIGFTSVINSSSTPISSYYVSPIHVVFNIGQYMAGFIGGELITAGQGMIIMSPIVGMIGLIGLLLNPFFSKFKLVSIYLTASFLSVFVFACFFYVTEGRYLFFAVPVLILSFSLIVDRLWLFFMTINRGYLIYLTAGIILVLVLFSQIPPVYRQLKEFGSIVNFDRNYSVIMMLNSDFKNLSEDNKIVVISVIPPYIFDYYSKPNYKLLPLSLRQTFMSTPEITWGNDDYSDLIKLYKKYINLGYILYLSTFKVEYSEPSNGIQRFLFYNDFNKIRQNFNLEKVANDCDKKCNLYKLSLK